MLYRIRMALRGWYSRKIIERSILGQILRKGRRFIIGTFQPARVRASIEAGRSGECHRCGACCELLFRCPFLGRDAQNLPYCRIYGDLRPANCRNYPFDRIDSEIDRCGFRFTK